MAHACMTEKEILERRELNRIFIKLTSNPLTGMEGLCPTNKLNEIRERISLLKALLLDSKNKKVDLHPNRDINNKLFNRGKNAMKILIDRFMELNKELSKPASSSKTEKNRRKKQRQRERQRQRRREIEEENQIKKEALEYLNSVVLSRTPSPSDEYSDLGTPNPKFEREWERIYRQIRQMSRQGGKKKKTKKRRKSRRKSKKSRRKSKKSGRKSRRKRK